MAVSKFMEEKWKKGFRFFDINKDGYLDEEDMVSLATYMCMKTGKSGEDKERLLHECVKWVELTRPDPFVERVSEEMFIQAATELHKDIENHKRLNVACYSTIFDIIDLDKDGRISCEELGIYYEGHGVKDEQFIRRVFQQLDLNNNGYVERDEMIKAGVNFWTSSDPDNRYMFMYDLPIGDDKVLQEMK